MTPGEVFLRVERVDNLANRMARRAVKTLPIINLGGETKKSDPGRYEAVPNIPEKFKEIIGTMCALSGPKATQAAFGISQPTARAYEMGKSSVTEEGREIPNLKNKIEAGIDKVRDAVLDRIFDTLDVIKEKGVKDLSTKEAAMVARNLAGILSSTRAPVDQSVTNNAKVLVYSPEQKEVSSYDLIEVNKNE